MQVALQRIAAEAEQRTGSLDLRDLGLERLPDELFSLRHLRSLDLGASAPWEDAAPRNRIDGQAQRLGEFASLEELSVRGTDLTTLDCLRACPHLWSVDCSYTPVADLAPLAALASLQQLDCSYTQVADLAPLAGLASLQQLDCSYTQVADLAPLAALASLQELNCSRCSLRALPASIWRNSSLRELVLYDSHVVGLPQAVLSQGYGENCSTAVRAHFADLAAEATVLTDIRVVLLGNGGVGKTQIARWLAHQPFDPCWNSTHGIQVASAELPGDPPCRLQIWDFGGQDIYHGTHALFLRTPAVMMPVWAKDRETLESYEHEGLSFRNHPLAYWIDVVRQQGDPGSPVLIVQNKCDSQQDEVMPFPVGDESLNALKPRSYAKPLWVSASGRLGGAGLQEALHRAIAWLRDPARLGLPEIGAGRLRVQRRLEAMRDADMLLPPALRQHRLLDLGAFEAICAEEGGVTSPALLLDYLDANGTVLYRKGLFGGRIVLDQGWALDAIYAVFNRDRVFKYLLGSRGRFSPYLLGQLVWREHDDGERKLLIGMMKSCGICFEHRRLADQDDDTIEYIAPDLLPERKEIEAALAERWDDDRPHEAAQFTYSVLHGGLIRTIMARIGAQAGPDGLYWRGGLCGPETKSRSHFLIEAVMGRGWQGSIRIRTQGGQAAVLLRELVGVVEKAQDQLGMRPVSVDRPSAGIEKREDAAMAFGQPAGPKWYVSYAWGDKTPEGLERDKVVDDLCAAAKAEGHEILRDKNELNLGDSISAFMRKIGAGDRVFVILSEKYLRSPNCMFELSEVWRTSRQEGRAFLDRVRVYALPDARISRPVERFDHAIYWKTEYETLNSRVQTHGWIFGEQGSSDLMQMQRFYTQVADILATIADIVQPRTLEELKRYGFSP